MPADLLNFSGLALMFALGLRHGLDPDHIACIDSLTWRALEHEHRNAAWVGTLFATGHGLLVTGMAVGLSQLAPQLHLSPTAIGLLAWLPTALLVLVGALNLRMLLRPASASASGDGGAWKLRLIPRRLREHSGAWAVIVIGALFAAVFDTATQAAAWGYAASQKGGGWQAALLAGAVFTLGMVITDSLDGQLICRVGRLRKRDPAAGERLRRRLGVMVVAMSFGVAGYNIAQAFSPAVELGDLGFTLLGLSLVVVVVLLGVWSRLRPGPTPILKTQA